MEESKMKGRLENEKKSIICMEKKMKQMPKYVEKFSYTIRGNEYSTVNSYINHVWRYLQWLQAEGVDISKGKNLNNNSDYYVGKYLNYLKIGDMSREKETTASYRAVAWTALNSFYDYMVEHHHVKTNPLKRIKRDNPAKDKVRKEAMSEAEVHKVILNIRNGVSDNPIAQKDHQTFLYRDLSLFLLLIDTGSRISGILELNTEDVDLERCLVRIVSKGHVDNDYRLTNQTCECISKWLQVRADLVGEDNNQALFISKQGNRLSYRAANYLIKKYTLGIDKCITPHTTRRTVATVLYQETGDIELVKDKMGHCSTQTTSRYIDKGDEHLEKAHRLSEVFINNVLQ